LQTEVNVASKKSLVVCGFHTGNTTDERHWNLAKLEFY